MRLSNTAALAPATQALDRRCEKCKLKGPKRVLRDYRQIGGRLWIGCQCGNQWATNVKRGEL